MKSKDNQTEFNQESAIFDSIERPQVLAQARTTKPRAKLTLIIGLGVLLFLVVVYAWWLAGRNPTANQPEQAAQSQPTQAPVKTNLMEQRLEELKAQLKASDPAKKELPFPQVDLDINL